MDFLILMIRSSDFSEFGESDDITFIDPDFGVVLSSDGSLDGHIIDYDASVILGTKVTILFLPNQIMSLKMAIWSMVLRDLMIFREGTIGILFMSIMLMMVLRIL